MKKAMSNVDVAAIVEELRDRILGGFVGKAYQQSSDKIWLAVQSPAEGRLDLLLEAGKRVHITRGERPASKTPPQFPTMLRSHLSGGRIVDIQQHDFDRVLEIAVERGGGRNYLIVETVSQGQHGAAGREHGSSSPCCERCSTEAARWLLVKSTSTIPASSDPRTISRPELSGWLSTPARIW